MLNLSSRGDRIESRKRRRTVHSCTECHRRKQKCDRQSPCCNCIQRGKESLCYYESKQKSNGSTPSRTKPSESNYVDILRASTSANTVHPISPGGPSPEQDASEVQKNLASFGYSSKSNITSLGLLRAVELCEGRPFNIPTDQLALRNDVQLKYTKLVRQLPPQACANVLIQTYFALVNWHYDLLSEVKFQEQLQSWLKVSYSQLQADLTSIAPDILSFPALLFEVLAQALLVHSPHDHIINGLLIMPTMTYHDLAAEYSSAAADMLSLLGKGGITITTVQSGLLHASFLKSCGKVVDAWHTLGSSIRDAQEIGLHTGKYDDEQNISDTKQGTHYASVLGHKIWITLHIWDAHMAVVLGRPMATNLQLNDFALTIGDDEAQRELLVHWRTENEAPRPFDIIMAGYTVAYRYFQDIHHLEHQAQKAELDLIAERLQAEITRNLELLPSWCRLENPSTKFDAAHGCQWLPAAREELYSLIHLVLLTLHRPHVFSKSNSRTEALKAGISILCAQERLFERSEPHQWNLFNPVYASFDAIVLIAAIYLVFPEENHERRLKCIQVVQRGVQRLEIVGQSNRMARSAHDVALSLYRRLMRRFSTSESADSTSSSEQTFTEESSDSFSPVFPEIAAEAVPPPHPVRDLFYDHLSSARISNLGMIGDIPMDSSAVSFTDNWNFEGDFSDESFWGFLNGSDSST